MESKRPNLETCPIGRYDAHIPRCNFCNSILLEVIMLYFLSVAL